MLHILHNSHGHPDHTQGNYQFDQVYIHLLDFPAYENSNTQERRKDTYERLQQANGLLQSGKQEFAEKPLASMQPLDTLDTLEKTLTKALSLPFDTYLGGHTTQEVPREFLYEVRNNVRAKKVDWDSYKVILGKETYQISYSGEYGTSQIAIPIETALAIKADEERGFNTALLHGPGNRAITDVHGSIIREPEIRPLPHSKSV